MDEKKKQDFKRHFYEHPVFVKWSHINTFLAYPDGLRASVPMPPDAKGRARNVGQDIGMNMTCILTFMVNHMGRQNINGLDTDEKDVTQAFFGSQAYIVEETTMSQEAVSRAFSALVDNGILIRDGGNGKKLFHAFSPRTIESLLVYSAKLREKELAGNTSNKPMLRSHMTHVMVAYDSCDGRIRPMGPSHMTDVTITYPPIIEEGFKDPSKDSCTQSSMDGCKGATTQPLGVGNRKPIDGRNLSGFTELCKEIEWTILGEKDFAHWETTAEVISSWVDEHGEQRVKGFRKWLIPFFNSRIAQNKSFKRNAPWRSKLEFCWQTWQQEQPGAH